MTWGTPLVWPCPKCGRYNAAALTKCLNCNEARTGQRAEPAPASTPVSTAASPIRTTPLDPPLKSDAERERANAAARWFLDKVGDIGEEPA